VTRLSQLAFQNLNTLVYLHVIAFTVTYRVEPIIVHVVLPAESIDRVRTMIMIPTALIRGAIRDVVPRIVAHTAPACTGDDQATSGPPRRRHWSKGTRI